MEPVNFLTRPALRLTTTVVRMDEGETDVDIDVYVLRHNIRGQQEPRIGVDVTGVLWLQGTAYTRTA